MSLAIDQILRLNQCPLSWTSTRSLFNGMPLVGVTEVNIEESREGEIVHGQQPDGTPLGITSGLYKVDTCTFQILADSAQMLCEMLSISFGPQGNALNSFGDARYNYQLGISEPLGPTMTVMVNGVKIEKRKISAQKGTGALAWDLECKAMTVQTVGVGAGLSGLVQQLWSLQRSLT